MRTFNLVFAYFSPETLLPATSIIATLAGVMILVGRGSLRMVSRLAQRGVRRPVPVAGTSKPHLQLHEDAHSQTTRR